MIKTGRPNGYDVTTRFMKHYYKRINRVAVNGNPQAQRIIFLWENKPDGWEFELFFRVGLLMRAMRWEAQS